jgi:hypothetical protein
MKYENAEYHGRYARALKGAQNLAALVRYEPVDDLTMLPPELQEGLCAPSNALIVLPAVDLHVPTIEKAVRETRTPVVVVEAGVTGARLVTFYFTVVLPRAGKIELFRLMRLWVDYYRQAYLVPDPEGGDQSAPAFAIDKGLREVATPWTNPIERGFGLGLADVILLAP